MKYNQGSVTKYNGHVDIAMQAHYQGWASADGLPASPKVYVNGKKIGSIECNYERPDLVQHGISKNCGFNFIFREPLTENDVVTIEFPDGSLLDKGPITKHQQRLSQLFSGINLPRMHGIELGPLDRPLLSKKRSKVIYVDNASTKELVAKTKDDDPQRCDYKYIVDVDYVWRDAELQRCVPPGAKYDYFISSHVIEHIPDMIGWMQQISAVLKDGGLVNFAIPHKTHTFDHRRRVTSASQFIGWHIAGGGMRPRPEQVFDHVAYASWLGTFPPLDIGGAIEAATRAATTDEYIEVHCNVFTEASFLEAFAVITQSNLLPLGCREMFPNIPGSNEFIVSLIKDEKASGEKLGASYRKALEHLPADLASLS